MEILDFDDVEDGRAKLTIVSLENNFGKFVTRIAQLVWAIESEHEYSLQFRVRWLRFE